VREALGRLTEEGFVVRVPHKGYFVAEITETEAEELFAMREYLELYSVERAIKNRTAEDVRKLREILNSYKDAIALGVSRQMFLVDENFHLKIAEIADSGLLKRILTTIFEKIIMKRTVEGISSMSGLSSYQRHLKILKAIEQRDLKQARKQIREHVQAGQAAVLQQIAQRKRLVSVELSVGTEIIKKASTP
jgi:DNA-binding GntR family transcriptional regulator